MKSSITRLAALLALLAVPAAVSAADATPAVTSTFYGYVKLDVISATQRTAFGDLNFYLLPTVAGQTQSSLNITARETRFGWDLSGPSIEDWKTTGKIELDFLSSAWGTSNENAASPRIRLAYIDLANNNGLSIRAGQDWDAFIAVLPVTLDAAVLGGFGNLYSRRPQVRVTDVVKLGAVTFTARAAAARTIGQFTDAGGYQDGGTDSGQPIVEGALFIDAKLWTNKAARISVSGHSGTETYDPNPASPVLQNYNTKSLIGSIILPVTNIVTVQGTIWQGTDLRAFYGGIYQGINTTLNRSIRSHGGWAQVVTTLTPKLNLNLAYGYDDPDDDDLTAANTNANRTLNTRAFGSVFYKINPALSLAFEYSTASTGYKDSTTANGEIYQGSAIYKF